MTSTLIDYVTAYFEFQLINNIHRETSQESAKKIKKRLKKNPQSLYSNISGGEHVQLRYVLNP